MNDAALIGKERVEVLEASSRELNERMLAVGVPQAALAKIAPIVQPALSRWQNLLQLPNAKTRRRVFRVLELLQRLNESHRGAPLNFSDVRWVRAELRKMKDGGGSGKPIPQVHGSRFIVEVCSHAHFEPTEFCDKSRLALRVADAEIVSSVAQRLIRAVATSVAGILASKNETFADYVQRYPDRNAALEDLFRRAFDALESEVGTDQMLRYEAALALTGEAAGSPVDIEIN